MKIGPKYKIARRLGAPVFEKTQTQKYALSQARKEKSRKFSRPKSEFGLQLIEKQKARFTYGLNEKQFKNNVKKSLSSKEPVQKLFILLESRLDNVLFRSGFAKTRIGARQMASHGHILVNGKRVTIPSILLKEGDVVGIRTGSASSPLFSEVEERMNTLASSPWIEIDSKKKEAKIKGLPVYAPAEQVFDLSRVIEFYNR